MKEFNNWFKNHVAASNVPNDDIKKLAASPIFTVMTFQAYDINGYTFTQYSRTRRAYTRTVGSALMLKITTCKRPRTVVK